MQSITYSQLLELEHSLKIITFDKARVFVATIKSMRYQTSEYLENMSSVDIVAHFAHTLHINNQKLYCSELNILHQFSSQKRIEIYDLVCYGQVKFPGRFGKLRIVKPENLLSVSAIIKQDSFHEIVQLPSDQYFVSRIDKILVTDVYSISETTSIKKLDEIKRLIIDHQLTRSPLWQQFLDWELGEHFTCKDLLVLLTNGYPEIADQLGLNPESIDFEYAQLIKNLPMFGIIDNPYAEKTNIEWAVDEFGHTLIEEDEVSSENIEELEILDFAEALEFDSKQLIAALDSLVGIQTPLTPATSLF
jgi:hypothetical protein